MPDPKELVQALREQTTLEQREIIRDQFAALPASLHESVTQDLIDLLGDVENTDNITRSWAPILLGKIGTPEAREALLDRLSRDESHHVRMWICKTLIRDFTGDDRIGPVADCFDREQTKEIRIQIARVLAESGSPAAVPKLIEFLSQEGSDDEEVIRAYGADGLGAQKALEGVEPLGVRLLVEDSWTVAIKIIHALVSIEDAGAVQYLCELRQGEGLHEQVQIAALKALAQLAPPEDDKAVEVMLNYCCAPQRTVALTAADSLIRFLKETAAETLVNFGLSQSDPAFIARIADALRMIRGDKVVALLKNAGKSPQEKEAARALLEQIGGAQAVGILVDQRMATLNQAQSRVQDFDKQALELFHDTVEEAKRGFKISLFMSTTIFIIGVILLAGSIYLMLKGEDTAQILGGVGALSGLGTILTMFYKGPMEKIERSVANLVQTEIAFLGYIRQVTQITAMFEREYLSGEAFDLKDLEALLNYTENAMKETMPLVSLYTARRENKDRK
ncbi:MAG: hypothetical protein QNK37_09655 [Acidobacteriota bacterium]|nr:hypothetical protein [Acidobacteriota bacterium]